MGLAAEYRINRCNGCDKPLGFDNRDELCFGCEDKKHQDCALQVETDTDEDGTHTFVRCLDHKEYVSTDLAEQVVHG